ncbi:hypothetical protein KKB40_04440, partial [Patescibacteria group bacterium]|nr:hypothetical protein [Patescibacteria group bacterium]
MKFKFKKSKEKQSANLKESGGGGNQKTKTKQTNGVSRAKPQKVILASKPAINDPTMALEEHGLDILDVIAPNAVELDFDYIKINDVYLRSLFISGYPRFVSPGWLEQVINFNSSLDISFYIYPIEGKGILDDLLHKVAEMEAEIATDLERGKIVNPTTKAKLDDARMLQEELVKGIEHFFEFGFYITIRAPNPAQLNFITKQIESTLGSLLVSAKHATLDMDSGFLSTAPFGLDRLSITQNMDTTSLSTTFPLTSAELSSDKGILYGINIQNGSFIIFDRFSMENSNMVIFATSGAGKSTHGDEPVLYKDVEGKIQLDKIGNVVEKTIKLGELKQIERDIEGVINPGIEVFTFDKNLNGNWSNVQIAARKTSPKTLYKITTKSGREIQITPDHCLVILKNGRVQTTKGSDTVIGNFIPLPRKVSLDKKEAHHPAFINTAKLLEKNKRIKHLKVKNERVGNRLFSKKTSIPQKFILSPHFFEVLGYFASEGMIIPSRALVTNSNKQVLNSLQEYYKSISLSFSIVRKNKRVIGIYVSAQTFIEFLTMIGASGKAGQKRVPPIVFSMPDEHIVSFLQAYFEGDGGVENHEISATTKSKNLASDLSYLLLRFGIIARISETRKMATNTKNKKRRV